MSENRGPRFPQIVSYDRVPKNLLINPGFEIWQRGAGPFTTHYTFSADEWLLNISSGTLSVARSTSALFGDYCASMTVGGAGVGNIGQGIEVYKSLEDAWVTFSVWVNAPVGVSVWITLGSYPNGVDYTPVVGTGTWQQAVVTRNMGSGLTGHGSWPHSYGAVAQVQCNENATVLVDGAVLAVGYFPEGLMYRPPNPAQDMLRCERYYQKSDAANWASRTMWTGKCTSGSVYYMNMPFSTKMAAVPTISVTNYSSGSFPATASSTWCNGTQGFWFGRTANATNNRGFFGDIWSAEVP